MSNNGSSSTVALEAKTTTRKDRYEEFFENTLDAALKGGESCITLRSSNGDKLLGDTSGNASDLYAQAATTVNFSTGWFGRLLCAGVDYQIEHHLFPTICHTRHKELSPLQKQYFTQHGWAEAILKSMHIVVSPGSTLTELPADSTELLLASRSRKVSG